MCRTKMAVNASQPLPRTPSSNPARKPPSVTALSDQSTSSSSDPLAYASGSGLGYRLDSSAATASTSSRTSLASLRESLPENAHIFDFSEIRAATNNFLSKRYSPTSSSQCWRTTLTGKDVIIFQRKTRRRIEESAMRSRLSLLCRSHQKEIIKLIGASVSRDHVYLVYEFVNGTNLSLCLRNPQNPNFTVLSTWMSRVQIATDIAHGLEYIHHNTGLNLVHKHVKSSGIIVTEPEFHAKLCHFGAADLCGDTAEDGGDEAEERRRSAEFEGVRGYMSLEFQTSGDATQKSDIYAFGVVLLELLCGEEPVRYKKDKASGTYRKISIIDTAREAVDGGEEGIDGRLRRWIDRRLKDSFPITTAEKLTRVALDCVHSEANKRPDMRRVAGKISKLFIDSKTWSDQVKVPVDISVSLAPR